MVKEELLLLEGGRTIAFEQSGDVSSSTVFLYLHGAFGVGDASDCPPVLVERGMRFLAPTLPGWGKSSPIAEGRAYHEGVVEDMSKLLEHLFPRWDTELTLYIAGGSFGTVAAQMLYGAPFDRFPQGRKVKGCLLLAPFSPFRIHKEYAKTMKVANYVGIGPPAQWVPFRLVQRVAVEVMKRKVSSQEKAEELMREQLFGKMGGEERAAYEVWREGRGWSEEEVVGRMAGSVVRSVSRTWAGFMALSDVIHSDWGFRPDGLDAEHTEQRPVLIVVSRDDEMAPAAMGEWLSRALLAMIHVEDKTLSLPDDRILAYADNGNTSSTTLVLFLHPPFSVGDASHLPRVLAQRNVHYVAPSLPAWGRSSPVPSNSSYATTLAHDITALITHLHPTDHQKLNIYLAGHSFGSAAAQMLYGLPHSTFPLAAQLKALVLLAPYSPPHCHRDYARTMSWPFYLFAGPLARYVPFYSLLTTRLARFALHSHFTSHSAAEAFLRRYIPHIDHTGHDDDHDDDADSQHPLLTQSKLAQCLARNAHRSVACTWSGFTSLPSIYHSTWGHLMPSTIETTCPVLVVSSENDLIAPKAMAHWLVNSYPNASLKTIPGGHLSAFFHLDDIWNQVFELAGTSWSPGHG